MEKIRQFRNVRFDSKTFSKAHEVVNSLASSKIDYGALSVQTAKDEEWRYNSFEEFLAAADRGVATFELRADKDLRRGDGVPPGHDMRIWVPFADLGNGRVRQ